MNWRLGNQFILLLIMSLTYILCFSCFTVDDLEKCSSMVGSDKKQAQATRLNSNVSITQPAWKKNTEPTEYFPFRQGHLAVAILRVGAQGIHMTVDGKHVTSFAFREVSLV